MLFQRDVVRQMIGLLFFLFPQAQEFVAEMEERQGETAEYYKGCMGFFAESVRSDKQKLEDLIL